MANTLKFGNGEWYGKKDTILAYNDLNSNYKPLPFNFSRDSSATVINKDGLIETVGSGQPRIDYKDDSKGTLLLEPSRTNSFTHSEDFSQFPISNRLVITPNDITSPDGTINASKMQQTDGATTAPNIAFSNVSAGTYTVSAFAKKGTRSFLAIAFNGNSYFDLQNGTITTTGSGHTASIENFDNDWYRCSIVKTISTTQTAAFYFADTNNTLTTADNEGYMYLYGTQLEQGSYATSYIPTNGSAVTRLTDSSTNCGAGTNIFSNTSAVWFIDFSRFVYDSSIRTKSMTLENSSGVEQIRFHFDQPANTVRFRDALNSYSTIGGYISMLDNTRKKVALKIDGTTLSAFSDGVKIGSDYTRPTGFDIDTMDLYWGGSNIFDIKFYNTALTDAELISLTS
jgi:hypothetical protein